MWHSKPDLLYHLTNLRTFLSNTKLASQLWQEISMVMIYNFPCRIWKLQKKTFAKMAFRIVKVMEEEVPALKSLHKRNFQACDISWTTLRNLKGFLYEEEKSKKLLTRTEIYAENFEVPLFYDSSGTNNCERNLSFLFTGNQIWYMGNREITDRSGWSHHTWISIEILFPASS